MGVRRLLIALAAVFGLSLPVAALAAPAAAPAKTATAMFAGGCFWCMETDMKAIPGVISVESGYTGGKEKNPTYEQVSSETTGHHEAVKVTYDPSKITYRHLVDRYWKLTDPTDDGGQFCDRGPSYVPAVFATPAQRADAEASKAAYAKKLKMGTMKTKILPAGEFWPAEEYHRNYAERHKLQYTAYRLGCGRDKRLEAVWGNGD